MTMHEVFIARQPILDRRLQVHGYELLFRHADAPEAKIVHGDVATSSLILNAFATLDFEELVGGRKAFINMTRRLLLREQPVTLPAERIVLEVLEDNEPDAALIAALQSWKRQGYQIALDDFIWQENLLPLVELADIVKVEIGALTAAQLSEHVQKLRRYKALLLAEKVETQQQFELCLQLGFDLFQGYFLHRPKIVRGASLPTHRMPIVMLLSALHQPAIEMAELEQIISRDLSLSYKLLRYLNSPLFPIKRPIDSIRQALVYLGLQELRIWASLLILSAVPGKPQALVLALMVRAKMCELLARSLQRSDPGSYFMIGLFSGLDALLDAPLAAILEGITLSGEVAAALLRREGEAGQLLTLVLAYEQGAWEQLEATVIPAYALSKAYLEAVRWTRLTVQELQEPIAATAT